MPGSSYQRLPGVAFRLLPGDLFIYKFSQGPCGPWRVFLEVARRQVTGNSASPATRSPWKSPERISWLPSRPCTPSAFEPIGEDRVRKWIHLQEFLGGIPHHRWVHHGGRLEASVGPHGNPRWWIGESSSSRLTAFRAFGDHCRYPPSNPLLGGLKPPGSQEPERNWMEGDGGQVKDLRVKDLGFKGSLVTCRSPMDVPHRFSFVGAAVHGSDPPA